METEIMKDVKTVVHSAIAGALTLGVLGALNPAFAGPATPPKFAFEKCYGITLAGKNDCQTANSSCAGTSKTDQQADAWIFLPKGTCTRIHGGSLKPKS